MANKKKEQTRIVRSTGRFTAILILLSVLFAAVGARMVMVYAVDGTRYSQAALKQSQGGVTTIKAKRGDILDRNGIQLATSSVTYNLILDPKVILSDRERYEGPTTELIEKHFGLDSIHLMATIEEKPDSNYVVLKKGLSYTEVEQFLAEKAADPDVAGVWLEDDSRRTYPFSTLACSIVGFMREGRGIYGLEEQCDSELNGTDGREYTFLNSDNILETERIEAENGNNVMTTIDYNVQSIVDSKIAEFKSYESCATVACVIQNPQTGEILAMADSNTFDCNNPSDLTSIYTTNELKKMSDQEVTDALATVWKNFCITQSYEPGSTYKPFTLAAGLEEGIIHMEDWWYCDGSISFLDDVVRCHYRYGHGDLDTKHAIAESCNCALMEMAEKIGVANFTKYQKKFGFGKYTEIDLPNEMSCSTLLYTEDNMREIDLATNSFGQNFNLTMIQMSTAYCSLVNGGYLYKPYVVKGIYSQDGQILQSTEKTLVARPISKTTSDRIKECLRSVVVEGTGDYAAVEGYVISGKTGTAEKTGRQEGDYLVSFIGFAPYENPQIMCYVIIDQPESGDEHGVSSHLFNMIMSELLPYLNITPASVDVDPEAALAAEFEYHAWEENHPYWGTETIADRAAREAYEEAMAALEQAQAAADAAAQAAAEAAGVAADAAAAAGIEVEGEVPEDTGEEYYEEYYEENNGEESSEEE